MIEIMAEKIKSLSKRLQLLNWFIKNNTPKKKYIVALLVVKNHYSRSPCSRLFGNQGEVQHEDFHNSMTSSGYRPPPRHKCLMDPRQLVLRIRLFFLSSVIRYIIRECVHVYRVVQNCETLQCNFTKTFKEPHIKWKIKLSELH